jgi:tetratricopeptide (TPR) repeat protein
MDVREIPESRKPAADAEARERERLRQSARQHYLRGNRFFDLHRWDLALAEWRRSTTLWRMAGLARRAMAAPFVQIRAVLLLLLTVLLAYNLIFTLFPRDPFDALALAGATSREDHRNWWERWLDTGRPQTGQGRRVDLREWWWRFRLSLRERGTDTARRGGARPSLDDRWEEMLRRYGRWGVPTASGADSFIIAGYGLSRVGEYEASVAAFEKGLARARDDLQLADLYQGLANAHYYQGYRLQPDGLARYDLALVKKAADAYERSLRHQERPLSYGNLGWMYFLLADYRRAEVYSKRALLLDESLEYVRLNLALVLLMQDRIGESFETYRQVVRRDPPPEVYLGGLNDLREVIRDHGGRVPYAQLMRGLLAAKSGDHTQARVALTRLLASPGVAETWRAVARRILETMDPAKLER